MYNQYNPYMNMMQQQQYNPYQQQTQRQEIIRVNGVGGANAYNLPPNSSALLLDEQAPVVWVVQTDGAGYKSVTPYDIVPHKDEQMQSLQMLESRISRLEEILNGKSNITETITTTEQQNATK